MSPAARAFWRRYYLLTVLLPAYSLAMLYYGAAGLAVWGLKHPPSGPGLLTGVFIGAGALLILAIAATLLRGVSYRLSGIDGKRIALEKSSAAVQRLSELQAGTGLPRLTPVVFEMDEMPFLALGPLRDELWVSTHTLAVTEDSTLRYLIAHEQAHAADSSRRIEWEDFTWLMAFPLCGLTAGYFPFWPLLAAIHVSLWLRWQQARTDQREAAADRRAAEAVGRDAYAKALVEHLLPFEELGRAHFLKARLRGMGFSADEIGRLLAARFEIT